MQTQRRSDALAGAIAFDQVTGDENSDSCAQAHGVRWEIDDGTKDCPPGEEPDRSNNQIKGPVRGCYFPAT